MAAYTISRDIFTGQVTRKYKGDARLTRSDIFRIAWGIAKTCGWEFSKALKEAWKLYDDSRGDRNAKLVKADFSLTAEPCIEFDYETKEVKVWASFSDYMETLKAARKATQKPVQDYVVPEGQTASYTTTYAKQWWRN